MSSKMEITISIRDEKGNVITRKRTERSLPYIEEIESQGFRSAFHDLETAVLEGRKEVSAEAVSDYLAAVSEKKRKKNLSSAT